MDDISRDNSPAWYIPHHGVFHPQKPGKICVVFDCSAKFQDISLNDNLLDGPDLTNALVGVLCRFRKGLVAVMCDVERIFHQFHEKKKIKFIKDFYGGRVVTCKRGMMINDLRTNGLWILGCSSIVSSHIFKCVKCRKYRRCTEEQKMGDLPQNRMETTPPFTYTGTDCFWSNLC